MPIALPYAWGDTFVSFMGYHVGLMLLINALLRNSIVSACITVRATTILSAVVCVYHESHNIGQHR